MTQLDELLSAAKSLDDQPPPAEAETRMWTKIAAQAGGAAVLGVAAATLGVNTASASTAAASTAAASTVAASTAAASTAAASTAATTSVALTVAKVGAALALTAGIGVGVATVTLPPAPEADSATVVAVEAEPTFDAQARPATRRRAPTTVDPVEDEVEILSDVETTEVAADPQAQTRETPRAKSRPRKSARTQPEPPEASALAAESALLGKARVASSSGRNRDALAALRQHAKQHPNGELAEVRRALEVRVLCQLGRTRAARKAADRFLARHKASALAGQVRSSCAYE